MFVFLGLVNLQFIYVSVFPLFHFFNYSFVALVYQKKRNTTLQKINMSSRVAASFCPSSYTMFFYWVVTDSKQTAQFYFIKSMNALIGKKIQLRE